MASLAFRLRMKIHRRLVYTSKASGKKFHRHEVTIPEDLLEILGWEAGDEVEARVRGKTLVFERVD